MRIPVTRVRWIAQSTLVIATASVAVAWASAGTAASFAPGLTFLMSVTTNVPNLAQANAGGGGRRGGGGGGAARNRGGRGAAAGGAQPGTTVFANGSATAAGTRIDAISPPPRTMPAADDYVLVLDSNRVVVVHPATKSYAEGSPFTAAILGLIGDGGAGGARGGGRGRGGRNTAGGARGAAATAITVSDAKVQVEKLGPGDTIEHRPTQHYRITSQFTLALSGTQVPVQLTSDLWTAPLPARVVNPMDLMTTAAVPTTGPFADFFQKLGAATKQIDGVPLKTVTTMPLPAPPGSAGASGASGAALDTIQTSLISAIHLGDVDAATLAVPDGFTRATRRGGGGLK